MPRSVIAWLLLTIAVLVRPAPAWSRCGDGAGDAAVVMAARTAIASGCSCNAGSHKSYVSCAARLLRTRVRNRQLSRACARAVAACVTQSTCGRPGTVTCCRSGASGGMKCKITTADRCQKKGGCKGNYTSCCDACGATGCLAPPTSTTTSSSSTTSTTTLPQATCGNGVIDAGEECDGQSVCDSNCVIRRDACCQYGVRGACSVSVPAFTLLSMQDAVCGVYGGIFYVGLTQGGTDACPNPPANASPAPYAGACVALPALAEPVTVCCEARQACTETTSTDPALITWAAWDCRYGNYPYAAPLVLGSCGGDGRCVPLTGPVTPTSSTTTSTIPTTCGNGVIDPGEQCDGESICHGCILPRFACCDYGSGEAACSKSVDALTLMGYQYPLCAAQGGTYRRGMLPASTEPCASPTVPVAGTYSGACIAAPPLPEPVTFCCPDTAYCCPFTSACTEITTTDHTALIQAEWSCSAPHWPYRAGMLGTCGDDGHCVATTTTTTTSSTTTTTLTQSVCGNGIIEPSEQCDGESFCSFCQIERFACCQYGAGEAACSIAVPAFTSLVLRDSVCGYNGGSYMYGSRQGSTDACTDPPAGAGAIHAGGCVGPPALPGPVTFCCQNPSSCWESTTDSYGLLLDLEFGCAYSNPPYRPGILGTCGGDGQCVPAH